MPKDSLGTVIDCIREAKRYKEKEALARTEAERKEYRKKRIHYETLAKRIKSLAFGRAISNNEIKYAEVR